MRTRSVLAVAMLALLLVVSAWLASAQPPQPSQQPQQGQPQQPGQQRPGQPQGQPQRGQPGADPWNAVAQALNTGGAFVNQHARYTMPRRDLTVRVGDVTVPPELALTTWLGFAGDPSNAMMMGELVVTEGEMDSVLRELAAQRIDVHAIHDHLVGEQPRMVYIHVHGQGDALTLARGMDRVLALTGTPRPAAEVPPQPLAIDTAAVWSALGVRGRAAGPTAQLTYVFVGGQVVQGGMPVPPALGYASPVNLHSLGPTRMLASGEIATTAEYATSVVRALAQHGMATGLHSHMVGEEPTIYFIHFWGDGAPDAVLAGLRSAIDASH